MTRLVALLLALALPFGQLHAEELAPLEKDAPAPFAGVLVGDELFERYVRQGLEADLLRVKLEAAMAAAREREPGWVERHAFVLGLLTGVVGSAFIVWQAARVVEAR